MYPTFSGDFLQWIHTFLSVLDTQSIQRSATLLCLSPSAVSHQIRKLENELGRSLFERTKTGMRPTQEATKLKDDMLPVLAALNNLLSGENSQHRLEGTIRLACLDRLAHELVPNIIRFRKLYPDVEFTLDTTSSARMRQLMQSGMADFGLSIYRDMPGDMQFTTLRESSAFLFTPRGNPWNLPPKPSWEQICQLPFIALTLEGYVNPILASVTDMPQPQNIIIAINSFILALQLVRQGVGVCIAPPLTPFESEHDYSIFNIDHIFAVGKLGIISRKGKRLSRQAGAFFDFLRSAYTA